MAHTQDLASTAKFILTPRRAEMVHRFVIQVVDGGALSTSFVIKGRVQNTPALNDTELTNLPYTNRGTGAVTAAGTAITSEGIYEVDGTGLEVVLDNTFTSGAGTAYYTDIIG